MTFFRYKLNSGTANKKDDVYLIADDDQKANWEMFFSGTLVPDLGATVDKELDMPQITRHRGPGDTGYTVKAHKRRYSRLPAVSGSNRPGKPYTVTGIVNGTTLELETRQFRILGSWLAFQNAMKNKAKVDVVVRNERGTRPVEFPATAQGGGTLSGGVHP